MINPVEQLWIAERRASIRIERIKLHRTWMRLIVGVDQHNDPALCLTDVRRIRFEDCRDGACRAGEAAYLARNVQSGRCFDERIRRLDVIGQIEFSFGLCVRHILRR